MTYVGWAPPASSPVALPPSVISVREGTALQPIVDAMPSTGGIIQLGPGNFYGVLGSASTPVTINTGNIIIVGVSADGSVIRCPILVQASRFGLESLAVRPAAQAYGIKIFKAGSFLARCWMRHVIIGATSLGSGDGPVLGLVLDGAGVFLAEELTIGFCTGTGLLVDSTDVEPNTTLKFDMCSFVGNGGYGIDILASCTIAEFNGGNSEQNVSGELRAANMNSILLNGMDFESNQSFSQQVEINSCNPVTIMNCNFLKISNATRALLINGGAAITIDGGSRFSGWGNVEVGRITPQATNCRIGVNHISGGGFLADWSYR